MTLAEHDAQLRAEGKWDAFVAQKQEREAAARQRQEELSRAEAPLVHDLRSAGFAVDSVWDLVNTKQSYEEAVRVLLDHLNGDYPSAIREGIARALAVPEARFAWTTLIKAYRDEMDQRAKDGLAVAVANTASDEFIPEVIELARNPRHGSSRLLLLAALERSRDPRAHEALSQLVTDPELVKEV